MLAYILSLEMIVIIIINILLHIMECSPPHVKNYDNFTCKEISNQLLILHLLYLVP